MCVYVYLYVYRNIYLNLEPQTCCIKAWTYELWIYCRCTVVEMHAAASDQIYVQDPSLAQPTTLERTNHLLHQILSEPKEGFAWLKAQLVDFSKYSGLIKQFWSHQNQHLALQNLPHLFLLTTSGPKPPAEKCQLCRKQVWLRVLENTPLPKFRLVAIWGFTHYRDNPLPLLQITIISDDFWSEIFYEFVYT